MSEADIELVRRMYEVFNSVGRTGPELIDPEDLAPDLWARFAPDLELHQRSDLPDPAVFRGRERAKDFFRMIQELFSEVRWEPREMIDLGHAVVADTKLIAVGRGSEVPVETDETDVFWFRDGTIVRVQGFPTREEALAAAEARY
jgi:ketosteroid isomerase-like protein